MILKIVTLRSNFRIIFYILFKLCLTTIKFNFHFFYCFWNDSFKGAISKNWFVFFRQQEEMELGSYILKKTKNFLLFLLIRRQLSKTN